MERGKLAINRAERAPYRQGVSWSLTPAVASDSWRTPEDMRPLRRLARGARALAKPRVRTVLVLVLVGVPVVGLHMRIEDGDDRRTLGFGQSDVLVDQVDVRIDDGELRVRLAAEDVGGAGGGVIQQLPEEHA